MATTGRSAVARWPSVACRRTRVAQRDIEFARQIVRQREAIRPRRNGHHVLRPADGSAMASAARRNRNCAGDDCRPRRSPRCCAGLPLSVRLADRPTSRRMESSAASEKATSTSMRCATPKVTSMMRFMASGKCCVVTISPMASAMPVMVVSERRGKRRMRRATMRDLPSSLAANRSSPCAEPAESGWRRRRERGGGWQATARHHGLHGAGQRREQGDPAAPAHRRLGPASKPRSGMR